MRGYIEYLKENMGMPALAVTVLVILFFAIQLIGELLEIKGKVVPEIFKIRKFFQRRKQEKLETKQMLLDVKQLLSDVNAHYSQDNITKRNEWMQWVNDRAEVYDSSIVGLTNNMNDVARALEANTQMTEEIFIQNSRDRIIDFATKVADDSTPVSREEFNRIIKVYDDYEDFLAKRNKTNGEVDINYRIINEAYEVRTKNHSFIEDVKGYS